MFILGSLESAFLLVLIELFSLGVTADLLRAKIDRISTISLQRSHFDPIIQVEGVAPPIIFARIVRTMNAFTPSSLTVFTQRNFSRLSSSKVRFYTKKGRFAFLSPQRLTENVHVR